MGIANRGRRRTPRVSQNTSTNVYDKRVSRMLAGRQWRVNYLHLKVADNEIVRPFDVEKASVLSSYDSIDRMVLYVDSEIPVTGTPGNIEGSSNVKVDFVPTIGDVFTSSLAGGQLGLFGISTVKRLGYNNDDTYRLTYSLLKTFTDEDEYQAYKNNISNSIVEEFVYNDIPDINHLNPIIKTKTFNALRKLVSTVNDVEYAYLDWIINENKILAPKLDGVPVFDPNIINFVQDVLTPSKHPEGWRISRLDYEHVKTNTILDTLLDPDGLPRPYDKFISLEFFNKTNINKLVGKANFLKTWLSLNTSEVTTNPPSTPSSIMNNTYIFSEAFYEVPLLSLNKGTTMSEGGTITDANGNVLPGGVTPDTVVTESDLANNVTIVPGTHLSWLRPTTTTYNISVSNKDGLDSYLNEENTNAPNTTKNTNTINSQVDNGDFNVISEQTEEELQLRKYLNNEELDVSIIIKLLEQFHSLSAFDRFYKIPIYLLLGQSLLTNEVKLYD